MPGALSVRVYSALVDKGYRYLLLDECGPERVAAGCNGSSAKSTSTKADE
jgi:hypothetical protein